MQERVSQQQPGQKIKTASKQQVIDWVEQANKDLDSKKDLIRQVFQSMWHLQLIGWQRKHSYPLRKRARSDENSLWIRRTYQHR